MPDARNAWPGVIPDGCPCYQQGYADGYRNGRDDEADNLPKPAALDTTTESDAFPDAYTSPHRRSGYQRCDECGDDRIKVINGRLVAHDYAPGVQCEGSYQKP